MKPYTLAVIVTALVSSIAFSNAELSGAIKDVTMRATIIALPNVEATHFSANHDFNAKPSEALNMLEKLVGQNQATSIANLALTSRSGVRATSESGKTTLDFEPVVSPDGKTADITVVINDNGNKIVTNVQVSNGDAKFLGSIQSPTDKAMTEYIFVRLSF
ncbi:MAG: hypothetical protein WC657_09605 [Candidatus Paceibacterota bacterium]|jgi:hypothetical protein